MEKIVWPVRSPKITSDYGRRVDPVTGAAGQWHDGLDIVSSFNDLDILAIADGIVVKDVDSYDPSQRYNVNSDSSIGRYVILQHNIVGDIYFTRYCHLQENRVSVGQRVGYGDVIGTMGTLGYSTGNHLHLDLYNANWEKCNPGMLLPDYNRIKNIK